MTNREKCQVGSTVSNKTLSEFYEYTCEIIRSKMKKEPIIETNIRVVFRNLKGQSIQDLIDKTVTN